MGRAAPKFGDRLYEYRPVSKWNLEESQGLNDEFLRWAWPQLERQDTSTVQDPVVWKAVYRFEENQGQRVLRYLAADPAAQNSCVQCHNQYENMPDVMARRVSAGTETRKEFQQTRFISHRG